jgi:hypothetical protein
MKYAIASGKFCFKVISGKIINKKSGNEIY